MVKTLSARHVTAAPHHRSPTRSLKRRQGNRLILTLASASAAVALSCGVLAANNVGTPSPRYVPAPDIATPFTAEVPDSFTGDLALAAPAPNTLAVPALGITAPITGSVRQSDGWNSVPASDQVGLADQFQPLSAKSGSTVIVGHVNFTDGSPGALGPLAQIQKGTPILAVDADGTVHRFKAASAQTYRQTALPSFPLDGPRQLVLITCGGELENVDGELRYTHNTVITAQLEEGPA